MEYKKRTISKKLTIVIITFIIYITGIIIWLQKNNNELNDSWWIDQAVLNKENKLILKDKSWWNRASKLKDGEGFIIDTKEKIAGRMLVRREKIEHLNNKGEAIVWIIDDDMDGSIYKGGDTDSDCYIIDYGPDGIVDRMIDYIDNDGDNDPDEMDIRYFKNGDLSWAWFGNDLDDDNNILDLEGYEYSTESFRIDSYGNSMIYMNKFNSYENKWIPVSECPFAFYDIDEDGYSEIAIRVSAVPNTYDSSINPDPANDEQLYGGKWNQEMTQQINISNVRYSFDIDNLSDYKTPLHYDFSFNMTGITHYKFKGVEYFNPKRRPPQITRVIPFEKLREISDNFEAKETGLSWQEQHDDTITFGDNLVNPNMDFRWEGVFWTWERRLIENTGAISQKWNMRREWSNKLSSQRQLYYSGVDRRIHLFGAEEGWIQIGNFAGEEKLGEIRMYDTNDNGYFDRWEIYGPESSLPVRVTTVRDEKVKLIPFNYEWLNEFYNQELIPEAIEANNNLITAMNKVYSYVVPNNLQTAMENDSPTYKRYIQDIIRERHYQGLRDYFTKEANKVINEVEANDLKDLTEEQRLTTKNSYYAWRLIRSLEKLDVTYGEGDYDQSAKILNEIDKIINSVK